MSWPLATNTVGSLASEAGGLMATLREGSTMAKLAGTPVFFVGAHSTVKLPATATKPAATAAGANQPNDRTEPLVPTASLGCTTDCGADTGEGSGAKTTGSLAMRARRANKKAESLAEVDAKSSDRSTSPISW